MIDRVYIGDLVSSDELRHSSGPWKKHGYVKKTQENGYTRYWYPEDIAKNNRKVGGKNVTEEDIKNAEEAYSQAVEEYKAAKAAYDRNPTEENKKALNDASHKLDVAGTGQSYAEAQRRRRGERKDKTPKEILKEDAKERLNNIFRMPSSSTKKRSNASKLSARLPIGGAKNPTTSQNKNALDLVVDYMGDTFDHYKKEKERSDKIDQWYKDGKPVITDENADKYLMSTRAAARRKKNSKRR